MLRTKPTLISMKRAATAIFLAAIASVSAATRTWTNTDGKTVEAELVSRDGDTVMLQTRNGRKFPYKLSQLSEADREFLKQEAERSEAEEKTRNDAALGSRKAKWHEDFDESLAEAKKLGLPVLLVFSGSDWCSYCIKLEKEVLDKKEFMDFANRKLVLMKADLPQGRQRASITRQNEKLKKTYKGGFPSMHLLDSEGKQKGESWRGYGGNPPSEIIRWIEGAAK